MVAVVIRSCPCGGQAGRVVMRAADEREQPVRIVECERCGLRLPEHDPSIEETASLYTGYGTYTELARSENERARRRAAARRLIGKLGRLLAPPLGGRFLEVGCAAGALLAPVAELGPFECHGVEIDPVNAAVAARALPGRVFAGTLAQAAFPEAHFRVVYLEQVIEHVPDVYGLLADVRRVLEPDGLVLIGTPNFRGLAARVLGAGWKELVPWEHVRMFTPRSLHHLLAETGFDAIDVRTAGLRLIRRRDRKDLVPLRPDHLAVRVAARALGLVGLGDGLMATARRPGTNRAAQR